MRAVAWLLLLLAGCGAPPPAPPCPAGAHRDDPRAARIRARLASVPSGAALAADADGLVHAICFAPGGSASVVDDAHVVILATDLEEGEAAARLGHLLFHLRSGMPDAELTGPDCDLAVERALAREAVAYVREVALQAELGAQPHVLTFDFTAAVLAASPDAREQIVLDYLRSHPAGAPGVDGLAAGYRARCEASR